MFSKILLYIHHFIFFGVWIVLQLAMSYYVDKANISWMGDINIWWYVGYSCLLWFYLLMNHNFCKNIDIHSKIYHSVLYLIGIYFVGSDLMLDRPFWFPMTIIMSTFIVLYTWQTIHLLRYSSKNLNLNP